MQCERCHGLMVSDHYLDMLEFTQFWLIAWRCTNCGNVEDDQIRKHRLLRHSKPRRGAPSHGFPQQMS